MNRNSKIFVAGHNGMVGSAIVRMLKKKKFNNIFTISRKNLDLKNEALTYAYLKKKKPDYVFIAAAKVGGIYDNINNSLEFLIDNIQIQNNLILGSLKNKIKNLIFLGSSCIYPTNLKKPLTEDDLFSGPFEKTNEAYALAKLTGIKMCSEIRKKYHYNYKTLIPCNLYGPNDNFDEKSSHFLPAILRKVHMYKAKKNQRVEIWGNGSVKRELMHVDDLARACIFFSHKKFNFNYLNVGNSKNYSINYYVKTICKILDVNPKLTYNNKMPSGVKSKVMNTLVAREFGWKPEVELNDGIRDTYEWYIKNQLE